MIDAAFMNKYLEEHPAEAEPEKSNGHKPKRKTQPKGFHVEDFLKKHEVGHLALTIRVIG